MRSFQYSRPSSVVEAVAETNAKFLGGGTNLLDLMKMGVEQPAKLIDITRLPMASIEEHAGGIRIGAAARNSAVASNSLIRSKYPVLAEALLSGASPQIRNMATVGGNLMQRTRCPYFYDPSYNECNKRNPGSGCAAIPGYNRNQAILGTSDHCIATYPSDMAVALSVLDATVQITGPHGERSIPIETFHRLPGSTPQLDNVLQSSELITSVDLPPQTSHRYYYLKVRDRQSYAFALVSVAALVEIGANGRIQDARFALGGVASKPWRVRDAERALQGNLPDAAVFQKAAEIAIRGARPLRYNGFKVELARRSIVRALSEAAQAA